MSSVLFISKAWNCISVEFSCCYETPEGKEILSTTHGRKKYPCTKCLKFMHGISKSRMSRFWSYRYIASIHDVVERLFTEASRHPDRSERRQACLKWHKMNTLIHSYLFREEQSLLEAPLIAIADTFDSYDIFMVERLHLFSKVLKG